MKILLIILALLAIACLIMAISLWRSSHYPGAEIGNMDGSLAKLALGAFLVIGIVFFAILYFRK
jgi:peptidoglycan biosynthesis protein MviN/MurJ (putative lipid II flippase)